MTLLVFGIASLKGPCYVPLSDYISTSPMSSATVSGVQELDPENELIGQPVTTDDNDERAKDHNTVTAPVITQDVFRILGENVYPQKALYGQVLSQNLHETSKAKKPQFSKVYVNSNTPFSAIICGVQGSGKSHSTVVLLESCLIRDPRLGSLPEPLSGLVFYFDTAAGGGNVQPCEAAYLSALHPDRKGNAKPPGVTVLALPSNIESMKQVYAGLPQITVKPLYFSPDDISGVRLLAMMKVDEHAQIPLYMESIMAILRSMEAQGPFNYTVFRECLHKQKFNRGQKAMLNIRLSILDSCLDGGTSDNCVSKYFKKGELVIIDLSSPFMDPASACGFFDIILGLFMEAKVDASGKLIVLDEAHKYLSDKGSSTHLTESLLSVIRQQRHLATRVIISTQEPTVVPSKFLELCSFIIAHRFSSPKWLKHLAEHVYAAEISMDQLLLKISSLGVGEAIMFSPTGLCSSVKHATESAEDEWPQYHSDVWASDLEESSSNSTIKTIGQGYLIVRSRLRITQDGGHSILAVRNNAMSSRLGPVLVQYVPAQQPEPTSTSVVSSKPQEVIDTSKLPTASIANITAHDLLPNFGSIGSSSIPPSSPSIKPPSPKSSKKAKNKLLPKTRSSAIIVESANLEDIIQLIGIAASNGLLLQSKKAVRKSITMRRPNSAALVIVTHDADPLIGTRIIKACSNHCQLTTIHLIQSFYRQNFQSVKQLTQPVNALAFCIGGPQPYQDLIQKIVEK